MTQFNNVTVDTKVNVYHDGKVTSTKVTFNDGSYKTIGVMLPGEYTFSTGLKEDMYIVSGDCEVKLPGSDSFATITPESNFIVPANSAFDIKINSITNYVCSYLEA